MATASKEKEQGKQKLAGLKKEIGELLANEGGKIDAGSFKDKYKKYFGKVFKLPEDVATSKLIVFFRNHMSDVVEISTEGSANFVKAKSKRKETVALKRNAGENEIHKVPATSAKVARWSKEAYYYHTNTSSGFEKRQQNTVAKATVNAAVERIIEELAKENFVDVDIVKSRLYQRFKVRNLVELGYKRDDDIPALKELIRKQREVNASIQAFVLIRSVSTLHELGQHLTGLYSEAREFEDLCLGPLVRQPLVYKYFKFPPNQEPPDITTLKVMKYLKQFMNRKKLWAAKVDMQEFLEYLTEQISCTSPYELGVKIESIGLMISVIKRCSSAESTIRKEAEKKMNEEIADEIEQHLQKMKKRFLGSNQGGPDHDALVNNLWDLSPVEILQKLFEYCMQFFQGKVKKKVEDFIQTCTGDKTCRKLFQLALHKSCRELVKPVEDFSSLPTSHGAGMDDVPSNKGKSGEEPPLLKSPPSKGKLLDDVKSWLTGKAVKSSTSMNIRLLARIEEHILHGYGFKAFRDLDHGSFLQFLSEHKELQTLVSLTGGPADGALGPRRKSDVLDLIQQCDVNSDQAKILKVIRAQYQLDGGFDPSSLDVLIEQVRQQEGDSNTLASRRIIYEACLVAEALEAPQAETNAGGGATNRSHVGFLGYQDEEKVLQCLYQTPLLEDYAVWSDWDLVFAPIYGNLKNFLRKVDHTKREAIGAFYPDDLVAMETSTGCLVRVTRRTSMELFLKSAKCADVIGTSGHLVSLVLDHGGVEKAPLALLANHMKEALLSLSSGAKSPTAEDGDEFVVKFAIKCLKRIPGLMRRALAMQIFFEPLKHVFGHTTAPGLVLKHCETYEEKSKIHNLGICLGITEWQEDFKKKLVPSTAEVEVLEGCGVAKVIDGKRRGLEEPDETQDIQKETSKAAHDEAVIDEKRNEEEEKEDYLTDGPKASLERDASDHDFVEREKHCHTVVDSIRRDQFGVGIELPPEHRQMMENQRLREGRGLHRLSSELYSKDTHFVLELVQNADDNRYPEESKCENPPSIAFFVNIDKVVVFNNEVGFEEKNIRALCDVGKSTKGKQRYGYIGQKGIGFKSVFRITDTPEVHSNGYHVKFDAKSGPTGYILPHWCNRPDEDSSVLNLSWTTRIVLPLKDEMKSAQKKTLIARFHDIQPSLLLFLRRLRQIIIKDQVSNTSREMSRRDLGENLIELKHPKGVEHWFVVKKELAASSMKQDIETTEIALAFPLPTANSVFSVSLQDVTANIRGKSLIQQPVFAFLPLRSYGFRFIVQGDFDVPSSREDVDKDSAWNQWLRQEIAGLFVQAFDDFKNHPCFEGLASVVQFLQFIPLEDEILDFFKPVTRSIIDGISRKQCIPVRSKMLPNDLVLDSIAEMQNSTEEGKTIVNMHTDKQTSAEDSENIRHDNLPGNQLKWAFPSQIVVAEDPLIEELISDKVLTCYLRKFYLHPDLEQVLNPPLRRTLGIETLSCRHLIDIGKAISSKVTANVEQKQSEASIAVEDLSRWVAKWLCGVYRCLERERDCSEETLQKIASLNVYPLSDGQCTKLSGQPVFLPLDEAVSGEQTASRGAKKAAQIIHKDLRSLHPMILTSLDDIGRSQVRKLLERLQVKCLTSRDMIKHHIIPSLRSNQKQMVKPAKLLLSYIVYIKEQWDSDPSICDLEELRECALLQTNKGFLNPSVQPVHFTIEYGNETNLIKEFPSVHWTVLDQTYLATTSSKPPNSWEKFFSNLGVVHFLAIERKDVQLSKSELSRSLWSSLCEFWPQAPGSGCYTIKDYASSELEELLSSNSSMNELKKLAEMLDQKWDDKYAKYAKDVPYVDEHGKDLGRTYSSFFLNLREKSWIPSSYGTSSPDLHQCLPREIFLRDPKVVHLLGNHAWYAEPFLTNQNFLTALGIRRDVRFDTMVQMFMKWVEENQSGDDQENVFKTSIEHMFNVYQFMEKHVGDNVERQKYLENVTRNKSVVFVPKDFNNSVQSHDKSDEVVGQFIAKKRVYWFDPSSMMLKPSLLPSLSTISQPRRMLQNYYSGLYSFFVNFLEVDESPTLKEYVGLMEAIASQSSMASGPIVDDMMRVYHVVGDKCMKDNENAACRFIKSQLWHLKVFPTVEDKWVSLEEKPLLSDDKSLEKLFREDGGTSTKKDGNTETVETREKVHFVKMGLQKVKKLKDREEQKRIETENSSVRRNVRAFFAKVCGIRNLSDCVSVEIISNLASECAPLQLFLHQWVPCIQRYLYHKQPVHHDKLQDEGMAEALLTMKCFGAEELEVVYRLSTHPSVNISIKKACGIDKNDRLAIYVTDGSLHDISELIKELARFFAPQEYVVEFSNFLHVLALTSDDQVESHMDSQGLDALLDDVPVWSVPKPEPVYVPVMEPVQNPVPETENDVPAKIATDGRQVVNETDGEPRGLQSWPPKSSAISPHEVTGKNPSTEQVLTMWPPPAPPQACSVSDEKNVVIDQVQGKPEGQVQPNTHLKTSTSDDYPSPSVVQQSYPNVVLATEEQPPNIDMAPADVNCSHPRSPRTSPGDVIPPQHPLPRPLAAPNGEVLVELEEIQFGSSIERTELIALTSTANAEEIGRWGEMCVYYTLLQKFGEAKQNLEVTWVNENRESGLPYDIVIKGAAEISYIEVKSTSSPEKSVLEISSQEIQFAFQEKEKYHLYRVYNAGNPSGFRVLWLSNLATNLDSKAVKLFILI